MSPLPPRAAARPWFASRCATCSPAPSSTRPSRPAKNSRSPISKPSRRPTFTPTAKARYFLDQDTFDTITLSNDKLGDALEFLLEGVIIQIDKFNGNPIGLQLPAQVELAVAYTEPGVRGDTASGAVTKPARLETGLEIRVPFFIKEGEKVKVQPRLVSLLEERKAKVYNIDDLDQPPNQQNVNNAGSARPIP